MTKQSNNNIKILFVCHGNICRSPMALYYFRSLLKERPVRHNSGRFRCYLHRGNR